MLVVLLGPSGVGKSAAIERLLQVHSWTPLISFVTRPERAGDSFKVSISDFSYDMLRTTGKLWSDVTQGEYRYALLRSEVEMAICSPQVFVVDFALASWRKYFSKLSHVSVYMTAETSETLQSRLISADRANRLESSLKSAQELEDWYFAEGLFNGTVRLINKTDCLEEAVVSIVEAAKQKL
jgi:guanylate kinase